MNSLKIFSYLFTLFKSRYKFMQGSAFTLFLILMYRQYSIQKNRFNIFIFIQYIPYYNKEVKKKLESAKKEIQDQVNSNNSNF